MVCCSHQSDRVECVSHTNQIATLGYVSCTNQIATLGYVSRTNQSIVFVLCLRGVQWSNGGSEGAVCRMESSFKMRNVGFSVILTSILLGFLRNAILLDRWNISKNRKSVTRAVKMVDSCSRVNGVLCTVVWSWLSFLHDKSVWPNFESNIAWGVDELQTF